MFLHYLMKLEVLIAQALYCLVDTERNSRIDWESLEPRVPSSLRHLLHHFIIFIIMNYEFNIFPI